MSVTDQVRMLEERRDAVRRELELLVRDNQRIRGEILVESTRIHARPFMLALAIAALVGAGFGLVWTPPRHVVRIDCG